MRRWIGLALGLCVCLFATSPAQADVLCTLVGHCTYEGAPFRFTVVDAETGQPLADVHALAEWVLEGPHGVNGPLMVQDAASGPDGVVAVPAWGPISGPRSGLRIRLDPVITLFKIGYQVLPVFNTHIVGTVEQTLTVRVRRFGEDGKTFRLERFRGTPDAWVGELDKATGGFTGRAYDEQIRPFRVPYLNRKRRVLAERDKLPTQKKIQNFFSAIEHSIRYLEELGQ